MSLQRAMGLTNELLASAQALAALTARLRIEAEGLDADPAVREQLDRVADALGARAAYDALDPDERAVVISFARSYLAQAVELMEDPGRASAWRYDDPVLLQAQGSASGVVAQLMAAADLVPDGARILDVGTGVAGLAIALCRTFPGVTVVGLDPWEPSLAIARRNVAEAGLDDRISLVSGLIQELEDTDGFDVVWLPSFFVPEPVLDEALERILAVARPGGVVVAGVMYAPADEPVATAVDDLFTIRAGGSLLSSDDAVERLRRAGFTDVEELERTWEAPLRFVVGRR